MARQDMDSLVNLKGIPRKVVESSVGGIRPTHYINLYYEDGIYMFQTDQQKSYTLFLRSLEVSLGNLPQDPMPLWFKAKYPDLILKGVV